MNKNLKKILSLLLALVLMSTSLAAGITAFGEDEVEINAVNFPDKEFENYVRTTLDKNNNGRLSEQERNAVTFMSLTGYSILHGNVKMKNLKGIEYFASSLMTLRCSNLGLESLDVAALTNMTALSCMSNNLTALDVSNNTKLLQLDCTDNQIETLTFGNNTELYELYCSSNRLTSIDVSRLTGLTDFKCAQNKLVRLDVTKNTLLEDFNCTNNHLRSLDLSQNTALVEISSMNISDQTVTAEAMFDSGRIVIPFAVDIASLVTSTSLDKDGTLAFDTNKFFTDDINNFNDEFYYTYSVNNPQVEDMQVTVNTTRSFFRVNFYNDEALTDLISTVFVNKNAAAQQPTIPTAPQCKVFDSWSKDVSNVTEDMDIYPLWKDVHSYKLVNFADGVATISCGNCNEQYTVNFKDCINAQTTDDNYCEFLDVVSDGYINAKDYAQLEKMF